MLAYLIPLVSTPLKNQQPSKACRRRHACARTRKILRISQRTRTFLLPTERRALWCTLLTGPCKPVYQSKTIHTQYPTNNRRPRSFKQSVAIPRCSTVVTRNSADPATSTKSKWTRKGDFPDAATRSGGWAAFMGGRKAESTISVEG